MTKLNLFRLFLLAFASLWTVALAQETVTGGGAVGSPLGDEEDPSERTIRDIIVNRAELSLLREALDAVGLLEGLLDDETQDLTLFAPSNKAMEDSGHMILVRSGVDEDPPRWHDHLKAVLNNHIVSGERLTKSDIFDQTRTELQSLQDNLVINQWSYQVGSAGVGVADQRATNGIVHIMDKIIKPEFFDNSFARLELQSEYGPDWLNRTAMTDVVDFVNGREILQIVRESGTTYAGCRIRAYNRMGLDYLPQTINGAKNVKYGELLNVSFREETRKSFLKYHLIPKNIYSDLLPNGFQLLVTPVADCAHMWITKNSGRLCFNDGCVVSTPNPRTFLASNGVGYVIDKCPICPGVAMMADYAAEYTIHNLRDVSQLFVGSEWNLRNLSQSVGDGGPVTLFAPINTGWNFFTLEDTTRLATDKWKRHLWDMLKHLLVQGWYTHANLESMLIENGGKMNMTMLTGENVTFEYDGDRNKIMVAGGDIYFSDIRGVDGLVHFTLEVPKPRSVTHTVYDVAKEQEKYRIHTSYVDALFLREDMRRLLPLTAFFAPNEAFEGKVFEITEISGTVLENHIFKELLWCEKLVGMAGQRVESHNGRTWLISVNEAGFPCFDTIEVFGGASKKSCVVECDILARNGIVHELDTALVFETAETRPPSPPTAPVAPIYQQPKPPTPSFSRPKYPSPTPAPKGSGASTQALAWTVGFLSMVLCLLA